MFEIFLTSARAKCLALASLHFWRNSIHERFGVSVEERRELGIGKHVGKNHRTIERQVDSSDDGEPPDLFEITFGSRQQELDESISQRVDFEEAKGQVPQLVLNSQTLHPIAKKNATNQEIRLIGSVDAPPEVWIPQSS
ncbi:MAG: hypothetical protein ACFFBD_11855 [Candidatus Hodarchaeota archaeon]